MSAITELFWRPLQDVRAQERTRFLFFAGLATLIGIAQTLGLAGSEALFMTEHGAELLPATIIGGSVATVMGSFAYAARVGNARNDTLFIQMLLGGGALIAIAAVGLAFRFPGTSTFLMCFVYVTQAIFINHLSTFTVDYFDTVASKRLLPLFTIGSSLGGMLGGGLAIVLSNLFDSRALIASWALFLFVAAALLRIVRRNLRGWGPIEIEEADETSVEGVQGAIRYVRASKLGMALVVSALGMVLTLVVAKYMWLDAFAIRFPDADDFASFIGWFLLVTNLLEIAILMVIVPWLIRTFGVPTSNLVHPVLTILSFGGLAFQYNVFTGAIARMNGEMLENALAVPIRALLCNAIPPRFRGRVKAFLELNMVYGAMSLGGLVLFFIDEPDPRLLAIAGAAAAGTYLLANILVRREYLRTLIDQLRSGRLDLNDLGEEIGDFEAARLADLWEQLLDDEGKRPSASLLKMIPNLASRGIIEPLRRAATHPHPDVRRSVLTELSHARAPDVETTLTEALADSDPRVRLAAIRGLLRLGDGVLSETALSVDTNLRLMSDPDPLIRAEAALRAGPKGLEVIEKMIADDVVRECVAALTTAPASMIGSAMLRVADPEPAIRAAAIEFVARSGSDELGVEDARDALRHADPRVRRAAVLLLSNLDSRDAVESIASAISDPSGEVQFAAEAVLASLGEEGIEAVDQYLANENERTAESALRIIARSGSERVEEILQREFRDRVDGLWYWMIAFQRIPFNESLASRFLHAAYSDAIARNRRICFRILEHLESPRIVRNVEKALRFGTPRSRGDALEVLSHLGDRAAAQHLVTLHESGPVTERIELVTRTLHVPTGQHELIEASLASSAIWIQRGALVYQAYLAEVDETHSEEQNMERLLALKQISLFNGLSLDQLEAVHQITTEVDYLEGEVIMREGEHDDQLYLLLEGSVHVYKNYGSENPTVLNELEAVTYIGEMAVLDGEPRSASIVASQHCRLLSLNGTSLRELVLQMPEISFEIFRVLATRVRVAESRLGS